MQTAVRGLIFDIDGTLIRGDRVMTGVHHVLPILRERGVQLALLTNDNRATIPGWVARLQKLGIHIQPDEIFTSATLAAEIVAHAYPGRSVLPVGDEGLYEAIAAQKLPIVEDGADVVVMGKDSRFTQATLNHVCQQIWNGAVFIATNLDRKMPVADGYIPATGAFVQAVAYATGVQPIVAGKPSTHAVEIVLRQMQLSPQQVIMVGDSLTADIQMGNAAGLRTALVLTGTNSRDEATNCAAELQPTFILENLSAVLKENQRFIWE